GRNQLQVRIGLSSRRDADQAQLVASSVGDRIRHSDREKLDPSREFNGPRGLLKRCLRVELQRLPQRLGMKLEHTFIERIGRLAVNRPQFSRKTSLRKFPCQADLETSK